VIFTVDGYGSAAGVVMADDEPTDNESRLDELINVLAAIN
jgi:hypothetical protein